MLGALAIPPAPQGLAARIAARIDAKTKPPGSLGRIEDLAVALGVAQRREDPAADPAELMIFAADHGIVAEGVSAWPSEVTAQMVLNFLAGGAAANVFARTAGAAVRVIDAGVASDLPDAPGLIRAGIRRGTRNAAREDALTRDEVLAALDFGAGLVREAAGRGVRVIA
ncbi:MAG: nicotinate-nucleotide--dimethylbenzimidazole phosphoribosyltransferase, partial [Thermohalobaculum sp.]|nr:nicotinate-nucleotide--dimethylbenzimidazole phosphoribosyltransferase [Thermohalobaculum sp.]